MPDSSLPFDPTRMKFGIGQPVPRQEDPTLLRGQGRYTDDLSLPNQLYAHVLRSPYAHAVLNAMDLSEAKAAPGVRAIITADDLGEYGELVCAMPLKSIDGTPLRTTRRKALAKERLRFVGDPIAVVVADTKAQAKDAAEMIFLDVETLPAATEASAAAAPGAPLLYDDIPGNQVLDFRFGNAERVAEAFAGAAHVQKLSIRNNRIVVAAMEPRSAIGDYEAETGRFVLRVGCQGVFGLRNQLADDVLKMPRNKVRVLTGNVGGSFGMKASVYPEYLPILHASKVLGRPVKWTDERSGSFQSDAHGRDHEVVAELALDAEGKFLAVRLTSFANMGAYLTNVGPNMATGNYSKNIQSNYATPLLEVHSRCILTNTVPVTAYRGAGRPEANYYMERLIEEAARAMGKSPIELRKINHIQNAQMPYAAASGSTYDGGDFSAILDQALEAADFEGFEARRAEAKGRGLLRGIGVGNFLECTAPPQKEQGGIRFGEDGTVTIVTGTLDYGQGHWSPFAQVLHQHLGVPFDAIRLVQGDSDQLIAGGGTGGSKSIMASGGAIVEAAALVVEKGRIAAAAVMETAVADIEFDAGTFTVAGTDRSIGIMELAAKLKQLPKADDVPETLDVTHVFQEAPMAFPNGCHVAEVEIDPDVGSVKFVNYVTVNDFGVIVNPMLVQGQAHGGIVQGIGQAIYEFVAFSEDGQLLSGSFQDYGLPRAEDVPSFQFASHPVPCTTNPLGAKGCGEAGCAGSLPAVMNAIVDALRPMGVTHMDMPATPEKIWRAIHAS